MSNVNAGTRVVVPMLLVTLLTFGQTASAPPQPLTIDGATSFLYKAIGGDRLLLHVFSAGSPNTIAQSPAILFFFGGGWTRGSVAQFVPQARHLAQRGIVAIVADYRVFARHGTK